MAGSVNKAILIGNLGKDPETKTFGDGTQVCPFPLATSETFKNREGAQIEQTEWHNVVLWRRLAEIAGQYLRKGSKVYIEGRIKTRSWDDDQGQKRYITEIEADQMTMLDSKRDGNEQGTYAQAQEQTAAARPSSNETASAQEPVQANTPPTPPSGDGTDDLPF